MTHILNQSLLSPEGTVADSGTTYTGDTSWYLEGTVAANGGSANVISTSFPAAGFQSAGLLSTVPCVVQFTGTTNVNGTAGTPGSVTLAANQLKHVYSITTDCTGFSIGANTTGAGAAGTIKIALLYNS